MIIEIDESRLKDLLTIVQKVAAGYTNLQIKKKANDMLGMLEVSINVMIAELEEAKIAQDDLEKEKIYLSRLAGMSEVATGVLHNVGNVLNSLNISADLINNNIVNTASSTLAKIAPLLAQNIESISEYLSNDEKGKLIPELIIRVVQNQEQENTFLKEEMNRLRQNIALIKNIVSVQQSATGAKGVIESVKISELADQAIQISIASLDEYGIQIVKDFQTDTQIQTDRLKVLQILVNLISNAKHAMSSIQSGRKIIIKIAEKNDEYIQIDVCDNGIGIDRKNLLNIFQYGYTTKTNGHGFSLHNSALAASEMGGKLTVESEGLNKGATFRLIIPKDAK